MMGGSVFIIETAHPHLDEDGQWHVLYIVFDSHKAAEHHARNMTVTPRTKTRIVEYVRAPEGPRGAGKEPAGE